jgi:hypothetical protein
MKNAFSSNYRKTPINVMMVELKLPLVETAGKRFDTLREDFYDNAVNLVDSKFKHIAIFSPYDIALSGGEPYGDWK